MKTIEQLSFLVDITELLPSSLDCAHVLEIGGGYGGLAKNLIMVAEPVSYTIVDIPEALLLQSKFLASFGGKVAERVVYLEFLMNQTQSIRHLRAEYDLCISTSAYTELRHEVRKFYFETILSRCLSGYILDTSWPNQVYSLSYTRSHMTHVLRNLGRKVIVIEKYQETEFSHGTDSIILWTT